MKVRLVKSNSNFNGVKDYYEVSLVSIRYQDAHIGVSVVHNYVTPDGFPASSKEEYVLHNRGATQSSVMVVDPSWTASSIPPKPVGFLLEDPETWGDLMWEQIPLTTNATLGQYDEFIAWKKNKPEGYITTDIDEFLLRTLGSLKYLPTTTEVWEIVEA
jgi:hypothetical protein